MVRKRFPFSPIYLFFKLFIPVWAHEFLIISMCEGSLLPLIYFLAHMVPDLTIGTLASSH